MARKTTNKKTVESFEHSDSKRKNIPNAEHQSVVSEDVKSPVRVAYERRNRDLDPQLVWRGKDDQGWSDLVVQAPPLYIQEKVHPKALIDDLLRKTVRDEDESAEQFSLFSAFEQGIEEDSKTDFYKHDQNWTNRMILGDSLQVMASLAEKEGLRGQIQCVYLDPPYGIKYNSNFQWSTTSRDVKDGKVDHITREPEQVKAFRDTWRDGTHSYLSYLRDRFVVARDLLSESGSIFVQIGDENVHRVRSLLDEVFGENNFFSLITVRKTLPLGSAGLGGVSDFIVWYAKDKEKVKYRQLFTEKGNEDDSPYRYVMKEGVDVRLASREELVNASTLSSDERIFRYDKLTSSGYTSSCFYDFAFNGVRVTAQKKSWVTNAHGMERLIKAGRLAFTPGGKLPSYLRYLNDFSAKPIHNLWADFQGAKDLIYVVQTNSAVVQRCLLMASDPGDLVLDPTCGSGTTAYVAEQWGRRWITIDTSRVALALARTRIMGSRFPYYLLADSLDGQKKEAEITMSIPISRSPTGNLKMGFVYERVPHITLKSIANNTQIDVIWDEFEEILGPLRGDLNSELGMSWEDWEIPRKAEDGWSVLAKEVHVKLWEARIARQKKIDASIAAKADFEYLYDKPFEDKAKVRVAGPFTVESVSPHRVLSMNEQGEAIDPLETKQIGDRTRFVTTILDNLKRAGVQQANKSDKIDFTFLSPWPGNFVCAEGRYDEGGVSKRAALLIGPEFGTVSRPDLVAAAKEAGDAGFDVLISCAFNYDAHSSEFDKLGRIPVLKARMNADLHMADDLKNTGKGNLFVVFGEPDIDFTEVADGKVQVRINGVDVFDPAKGEVRSDDVDGIACWFIDTDYNEESFFVRHAYFLGAGDPYKSLKTTLKAEINEEAWQTLYGPVSRPFPKPSSGRIAVKVINHLGDEVMKVFRV